MDNRKIGVFDSGLGGLTVVREMRRYLPNESIVYFGDTARLPYGSKSKERIVEFSEQIVRFLMKHDVKAVIVACGTASSNAVDELRQSFDVPIFGVVSSGAKQAAQESKTGRIGVAATAATVRSKAFTRLIKEYDPKAKVFSQACPLFVSLVEAGWWDDPVTQEIVRRYMEPLKENKVDTVVLGCTHYPMLKPVIQKEMGEDVKLVNVSLAAVKDVARFLKEHDMENGGEKLPDEFYASDSINDFADFCQKVLEEETILAKQIDIEKY